MSLLQSLFRPEIFEVNENSLGGRFIVNLRLSAITTRDVSLEYNMTDITTTKGMDYREEPDRSVMIRMGQDRASFSIPIINDEVNEGNETFTLKLSNIVGAASFSNGELTFSRTVTINDNEPPTLLITNRNFNVMENIGNSGFVVSMRLSNPASQHVTFEYGLTAGSATESADYTQPTNRRKSIGAGDTTDSITIPILNDEIVEGTETFDLIIRITAGAVFATNQTEKTVRISIFDDELPTLSFKTAEFSVNENVSESEIGIEVMLSVASHQNISFIYDMSDISTTKGDDYTEEMNRRVTIAAGQLTGTFSIPIINDEDNEGNETFMLTLSGLRGAIFADEEDSISESVIIVDNESPTLVVTTTDFTVAEDVGSIGFEINVQLSGPTSQRVTFDYGMMDGSALESLDYTEETNSEVTIPVGQVNKKFSIPIINDQENEGEQSFTLTLSELTGAVFKGGIDSVVNTVIIEDDEKPVLSLTTTSFTLPEDDVSGQINFDVKLSGATGQNVSFDYGMLDVTTTKGIDYTEAAERTVTIVAGETNGSFSIPIINDTRAEGNETFILSFSKLSGAVYPNGNRIIETITIIDNDSTILSFSTTDFNVVESVGSSGLEVSVKLSSIASRDVSFYYWMLDGSATKGVDYSEATNRSLTIPAGQKTTSFTIPIIDDSLRENSETFTLNLTSLLGAAFPNGNDTLSKVVNIIDDETPTISVTTTDFSVGEDRGTDGIVLNFALQYSSSYDVQLTYATANISAIAGMDYRNTAGTLTISTGDTTGSISIPILEDENVELSETFRINLTSLGGAQFVANFTNSHQLTITILDNDAPTLSITGGPPVKESDTLGSPAIATFILSIPIQPVTTMFRVNYTPVSETFIADSGIPSQSEILNFTDSDSDGIFTAELPITIASDQIAEENGVVTITLNEDSFGSEKYFVGSRATASVVVNDDDAMIPELSIVDITEPVPENQGIVVFTITADMDPGRKIWVNYTPAEVASGNFLTNEVATPTTTVTGLTFTTTAPYISTLNIPLHDDQVGEATGKIRVTLNDDPATPDTYTVVSGANANAEATIWDDDAPELVLSTSSPEVTEAMNAEAVYTVSARVSPTNTFEVYYRVWVLDAQNVGNFITIGELGNKTKRLDLTGGKTDSITVPISNDDVIENDSAVFVALTGEVDGIQHYSVSEIQSEREVRIDLLDDESLPVLRIANPIAETAESAREVAFILSTTTNPGPSLMVRYDPSEVLDGNFLDSDPANNQEEISSQSVIFSSSDSGQTYTGTLSVPIHDDDSSEVTGQIMVTLLEQTGVLQKYQVGVADYSATATIWDDDAPMLSITNAPNLTETADAELRFPLTALVSPDASISVYYTLEESIESGDGDFIATRNEGSGKSQSVNFSGGSKTGDLVIEIDSDDESEGSSIVTVILESQPGNLAEVEYHLATPNTPVTGTIFDDDSLPLLSIANLVNPILESSALIDFVITSSVATTLTVRYQASEVSVGDFLTADQAEIKTTSLTFAQVGGSGPFVDTLAVSIHDDEVGENTGQIEVTLLTETELVHTYQVKSDGSADALATIWDDDAPVISIGNAPNITESANVKLRFPLTALVSPVASISIYYTLAESTELGDGDFIASSNEGSGKSQSVDFSGGSKSSHLVIEIDSDDDPESSSTITVTLEAQPGNLSDANYNLSSTNTPATATVIDDDSLPVLSIADVANPVAESSGSIDFVVTSTVATTLTIRFQASEVSGGDFLTTNQAEIKTASFTFAQVGGSGPFVDTLAVSIHDDEVGENTGQIEVTLLTETELVRTYQVKSDGTADALATIWDDDAPVISISNASNITESANAELRFPLTALVSPDSSISIYYTLAESTQSGDGNFIASGGEGSGKSQLVDFSSGSKSGHLVIPIESDSNEEGSSEITVTLEAKPGNLSDANYNLSSTNTPATTTVLDDDSLPVLSITDVVNPVAESSGSVDFVVTSTLETSLTVRYQASEAEGGDFLTTEQAEVKNTSLTFAQVGGSGPFVDTLAVSIHNDEVGENSGQIEMTLLRETGLVRTYQIKTNGSNNAAATIWDDDAPVLSISNASNVTESANAELRFSLTALVSPNASISIYYTLAESTEIGDGDFIVVSNEGSGKSQSVDFSSGSKSSHLVIEINSDDLSEGSSEITVTLEAQPGNLSDANYNLSSTNTPGTATVFDDDSLPLLSIADVANPVVESSGSIDFVVTSSVSSSLTVRYQASEISGGDFLTTNQAEIKTASLTFVQVGGSGPFVDTLAVSIHDDEVGENTGQIEVTLLTETELVHTYQVKSDGSADALATIWDDDAPVISISNASNVTESVNAELRFPLTALVSPNASISIYYTLAESTESGDGDFIASGGEGSGKSQSVDFSGGSKSSHLVVEIDSDDGPESSSTITVTMEAQPGNLSDANYNLSSTNTPATATVFDDDSLPLLSIADVANPVAESSGSIDFVVTSTVATTLTIRYQASEVNSGDFLTASQAEIKTVSLTFAQVGGSGPFVDTLAVSIHDDEVGEDTGQIEVTMLEETELIHTYQVKSDGTEDALATIWDDDAPVISIGNASNLTESANAELRFPLTALVSPNASISIYYTLAESTESEDGNFIVAGDEGAGKSQSVDFSGGSKSSHLVIGIKSDELSEGSSEITVTLEAQPGNLSDANYNLASTSTPATASVFDDDSLPVLSIVDVANPIAENTSSIDFVVSSSAASTLTIRYQASEVNSGDFLTASQAETKTASLTFAQVGGSGPFIDTLVVPIHDDEVGENTGQIEVTLLAETELVHTYQVNSDGTEDALATIWDDDAPVISIGNASSLTESANAELRFPLTALVSPNASISIYYTLVESTEFGDGNFIATGNEGSGKSQLVDFSSGSTSSHLVIPIESDSDEEGSSVVSVTLESQPGSLTSADYNLGSPNTPAVVTISDDDSLPVLSIADVISPVAESVGSINFVVTASAETSLTVRYQASEVSGSDFLTASQTEIKTINLTFAQVGGVGRFVDMLNVSIHNDEIGEDTGQIKVTLLTETENINTYRVLGDSTADALATIWDDDAPVISIGNAANITESLNAELRFTITALVSPNASISIYYMLAESTESGDGDFITAGDEGSGKFQSVDFSSRSENGHLVIPIESDSDEEGSSIVTVTLEAQPGNLSDANYNLASTNTPATASVFDDDSLPVLSITDVARPFAESSGSVEFVVTSSIETSLTIRYQASEVSGGDFLTANQAVIMTTSLTFAQVGGSGPFVDTLAVSIYDDEVGENTGQIKVTLLAETELVRTYQVNSDGTEDAIATIWDDDAPVISISSALNVTELVNAELQFPLTALVSPNTSISIYYTLAESTVSGDGDFIVSRGEGSGKSQSVDFSGGSKSSHLVIPIESDTDEEGSSEITVTLEPQPGNISDANYNLSSINTPGTATVFDDDSLPLLSIADVANPVVESSGSIDFVVTSSVSSSLTVRYQASEISGGDFLTTNQAEIKTASLTFAQVGGSGPFVDTLAVSIHDDEVGENTGQIEVTLLTETELVHTYQVKSDGSADALATIWDDDAPVISISNASNVTESANAELRFPLTALVSPNASISIYYTLAESTESGDGNFIASGGEGTGKFLSVDFSIGSKSGHLVIPIKSDSDEEGSSIVTVTLEAQPGNLSDANYNLSSTNTPATATVLDDDSLPVLSIADVANPIAENTGSIDFVVTSTAATTLTIRYQASKVNGGNFLTASQAEIKTASLTFAQVGGSGPFVDSLVVLIHNDEIGENTGQIKVTLLAETGLINTYQVKSDGSEDALALIWDDDAPVISISNASNVTEFVNVGLRFPLTALVSPNASISIYYTLTESTESGDGDFITVGDEGSGKFQSVDFSSRSENGHLVIPIESDSDEEGSSIVTVTLEAQPGNLSDANYNLSSTNIPASATVYDDDSLPVLSVAGVASPVAENSGSVDFVVTSTLETSLTVRYQASEVSGGDFLTTNQAEIKTASLTFAQVGGSGPFVDTLAVSIHDDEVGENTGQIEVTLLTETELVHTYQVKSDGSADALATIWDDDAPVISISNALNITESANAELRFPLTALVSPDASISIYYTLAESTESGDGDFIASRGEGAGKSQSVDFSGGSNSSHLVIEIDSDDDTEGNSTITVTLEAQPSNLSDANYNLVSTNTPATASVFDDDSLPILSIADVANPIDENTGSIDFVVSSSAASTLTIRYQASEVNGGDFLTASQAEIKTESLTFAQEGGSGPFVDTLAVSIQNDEIGENTGQIKVTLLKDTKLVQTYRVKSDGTEDALATIWDDDAPVISIGDAPNITESVNAELRFPLAALVSPDASISIYYILVESTQSGNGDFITTGDEGSGKSQSVDFSNGSKSSYLMIEINSDDLSEGSSEITVTLEAQPGNLSDADYNLSSTNTPATASVFDDDSLPILSISDVVNPIEEHTGSIDFVVTSLAASTLTIRYQASEVNGGDFLTASQAEIKTASLTFTQVGGSGPFVDTLIVPIHNDEIGENTGQIKVTLLKETELVHTYQVISDDTADALATIWDDDAPVISISSASNVTELVNSKLRFPLTALVSPDASISIFYTLVESTESGDGDFINVGDEGSGKSQSVNFSGDRKSSHLVIGINSDDLSEGSSEITVTLEALPGNLSDANYNLSSTNSSVTATVFDDDSLPVLSIADVVNPIVENSASIVFAVKSSVVTSLTVRYQASEVNGGDFLAPNQAEIKTQNLTFVQEGGSGPFVDTLAVSIHDDEVGENTGQIKVALLAETGLVRTYRILADGTEDATATIWDDDAPVLSISNVSNITESVDAELRFPLTTLVSPDANITVYYTLVESTESGDGDFIVAGNEGTEKSQSVDFSGGSKSSHLVIEIDSDADPEGSSTITVTLEAQPGNLSDANYNLASTNTPATAIVFDDDSLPILSIADVANPVAESSASIDFVVTSSIASTLTVRYQASEISGGDFLTAGQAEIKTASLTFAQIGGSGPFVDTLAVSIHDDEIGENTGQIEVALLAETGLVRTYRILADGTEDSSATIWDDDAPVLSISNAANITESMNAELRFPLTALVSPNASISIYYTLTESTQIGDGDFITSGGEGSGKSQSVDFRGGSKSSHLVIEIDSDADPEGSSTITVTLVAQPSNLSDANYILSSTNTPATASVFDDDSLPVLSISDVINPVVENTGSVDFVITSSIKTSLSIRYQANGVSGGNFLTAGQAEIKTEYLTFAQVGGSGPFIDTLAVSIHNDEVGENTGQIEVTLLEETELVRTYRVLTDGTEDATTTIWDDDAPVISISNAPNISESTNAELRFLLTTLFSPDASISVYYTLTESTQSGDGDFIATSNEGSGKSQSVDFSGGSKSSYLVIEIDSDDISEGSSEVTVTLEAQPGNLSDANYNITSTNTPATATVFDDDSLPVLSIADVASPVAESIGSINFEVTALAETTLTVRYQASELNGGDFLTASQAEIKTTSLTFAQVAGSGPFVDRLSVLFHDDEVGENTGQIEVTLLAETGLVRSYHVNSDGTENAIATIWDDDAPEISIADAPNITESANAELRFPLTTLVSPNQNISIYYTLAESTQSGNGDFIAAGDKGSGKFQTVDFSGGSKKSHLVIEINTDEESEGSSLITVTLKAQPGNLANADYNLSPLNSPATATISDDDSLPVLSINDVANPVAESSGSANFFITSSVATTLTVRYQASEVNAGDFLTASQAEIKSKNLTFAQLEGVGPFVDTLVVSIHDDEIGEATGKIQVTLLAETGLVRTYNVNSDGTENAVATIWDDDAPVISIANAPNVTESANAELRFPITALVSPDARISVHYTLVESAKSGDGDFITAGDEGEGKSQSVDFSGGSKDNHLVIEIDSDDESEGSSVVTITLERQSSSLPNANYNLSSPNSPATATISDDDSLPILSIEDVKNPVVESAGFVNFKITASIACTLTVFYEVSEVNNGDFLATSQEMGTSKKFSFKNSGNNGQFVDILNVQLDIDNVAEATGPIEVSLLAEPGKVQTYRVLDDGSEKARAMIWDDDDLTEIFIVPNSNAVEEGSPASFWLLTNSEPSYANPLQISYDVEHKGNFILWRIDRGIKMIATSSYLVFDTHDDDLKEQDGYIRVTLINTESYVSPDGRNSATITINDNDGQTSETQTQTRVSVASMVANELLSVQENGNPISAEKNEIELVLPTVSVHATNSIVNEGSEAEFIIRSNTASNSSKLIVSLDVRSIGDFFHFKNSTHISAQLQGQNQKLISFQTIDDTHAEEDGSITVSIISDQSFEITPDQGVAVVTISDAIDRKLRENLITESSQAFLPDVLGNMVARNTDALNQRMQSALTETNNIKFKLGGQESISEMLKVGGEIVNDESTSIRTILGDSSFALTVLSDEDSITPVTLWGIGDNRELTSSEFASTPEWSGEAFTGQLGLDSPISNNILTGVSASFSENKVAVDSSAGRSLEYSLNSLSVNPYIGWHSSNHDAEFRSMIGYGVGEFGINQTNYDEENFASKSYSIALAGNKVLYASDSFFNGKSKLNIFGESWLAKKFITGKEGVLNNIQTDAHHLKFGTEGTHQIEYESGTSQIANTSIGLRSDSKGQYSHSGLEFASGTDITNPIGVTFSGSGRMFLVDGFIIQNLELESKFSFDHGNDDLGLTFMIAPAWGQVHSDSENTLWNRNILENEDEVSKYINGTKLETKIGYGISIADNSGILKIYSGNKFENNELDELIFGTQVSLGPNFSINLKSTSDFEIEKPSSTKLKIRGDLKW